MDQRIVRDPSATASIRRAMVDNQIRTFDVTDQVLLDRFYTIPREFFVPQALASLAYSDAPLTLTTSGGTKRVLLVPMVLARLLQGASIQPTDRVLVVGAGTGYTAAIIAGLASRVVALEGDADFTQQATAVFQELGLTNVEAATGPLADGDRRTAPHDVIVVSGAVEGHLEGLLAQLSPHGRLVTIQKQLFDGVRRNGKAVIFERFGDKVSARNLFDNSTPVLQEFRHAVGFEF